MANDPVQTAKSFEVRGEWFRWSRYDLLNGLLVPAEGAQLQKYDPWEKFRANAGKYRTVDQPYVALLNLDQNLESLAKRGIYASKRRGNEFRPGVRNEAHELILDWCNRYGLLGLLPVLSKSMRVRVATPPDAAPGPTFVQYYRLGGIWHRTGVLRAECDDDGGYTWLSWPFSLYQERPIWDLREFFRPAETDSETEYRFQPPCPWSNRFWETYCEPVEEFERWCSRFSMFVETSQMPTAELESVKLPDLSERALLQIDSFIGSNETLALLADAVSPSFRFNLERNTVDEERVSAGLLASYALMFLWDRIERRHTVQCGNCRYYFVSDLEVAGYCSPRCRNTAQKRRSRGKNSGRVVEVLQ
ncbi:MAG TPA: hypothetical protein VN442_00350 [Bryobacteraceae bacterium]|nr:hypothetical protein [Bryobacteraceae bacterium]